MNRHGNLIMSIVQLEGVFGKFRGKKLERMSLSELQSYKSKLDKMSKRYGGNFIIA